MKTHKEESTAKPDKGPYYNGTLICNPPLSFMTNMNTHIGHLFFITILDVYARFIRDILQEPVLFPGRVYNLFGKPSQKYMEAENLTKSQFREFFKSQLETDWQIRNLNLIDTSIYIDDNVKVRNGMRKVFELLDTNGYLIKKGKTLYLNVPQIDKQAIAKQIESLAICPKRVKKMLLFHLKNNTTSLIPITRDRWYAPKSHTNSDPIAPVFIVSNFLDVYFPNTKTVLACSFNLIVKSALFRVLIHQAAYGNIGLQALFVYPKFLGEETKLWPLHKISESTIHKDLLRLSMMSQYTQKRQKIYTNNHCQKFAIRFARRLVNIGMYLEPANTKPTKEDTNYKKLMSGFSYNTVIQNLATELNQLSKNKIDNDLNYISYNSLLRKISPFMPELTEKIRKGLETSNQESWSCIKESINSYERLIFTPVL